MNKDNIRLTIIGFISMIIILSFCLYFTNKYSQERNELELYWQTEIDKNKQLNLEIDILKKQIQYITEKSESEEVSTSDNIIYINGGIYNHEDELLKKYINTYISSAYRRVPKILSQIIAELIVDISRQENISPELVVAIIEVESSFNPMSVGIKTKWGNARGLMQVMPEWVKKFNLKSVYDLHDIQINIESGIKVLKIHIKENNGDLNKGLFSYVNKSSKYVEKVYSAMGRFAAHKSSVKNRK